MAWLTRITLTSEQATPDALDAKAETSTLATADSPVPSLTLVNLIIQFLSPSMMVC